MEFTYKKETNLKIGQRLYGIIGCSIYTQDGVHPIVVGHIDFNNEEVIFETEQPCGYMACEFGNMKRFVFESMEEAESAKSKLEFGLGLHAHFYDGD